MMEQCDSHLLVGQPVQLLDKNPFPRSNLIELPED